MKNHNIDLSRCVACMDCLETCKGGAIKLAYRYKKTEKKEAANVDKNRRAFIASSAIAMTAAASAKAQILGGDGGLAPVSIPERPERNLHPVPAGSKSVKNFNNHCTACQLCVSVCPNQVLRPSTDFDTLMLPQMSFERGYCRPECTLCSEVCPTGAICKVNRVEKSSIQIGLAVVNHDLCIVNTDNVSCGNCARHCPAHAVRMVRKDPSDENSLRIPTINESRCIGCGACENVCPARPLTAIHIEGFQTHKIK
jgi:formate hydrogenlyase subunit 6/NADH:ubiquinone oxidoreductase subunit I